MDSSDKYFKRVAFAHAANAVNAKIGIGFTPENVENHCRTLKARYIEIKKVKELSGAGWDDDNKMITLDPVVTYTYTKAHPAATPFINKPIENYESLKIICGDDNATRSYATSLYSDFRDKYGSHDNEIENNESPDEHANSEGDGDANSAPLVPSCPATSSTFWAQRAKGAKNNSMMAEHVNVVREMAAAISCPTHWSETLYAKVMEVEGFSEQTLKEMFDHLQEKENEAHRFMAKRIDPRQAWVEKFLTRNG